MALEQTTRPRALILKRERKLKILTFLWLTSVWNIGSSSQRDPPLQTRRRDANRSTQN